MSRDRHFVVASPPPQRSSCRDTEWLDAHQLGVVTLLRFPKITYLLCLEPKGGRVSKKARQAQGHQWRDGALFPQQLIDRLARYAQSRSKRAGSQTVIRHEVFAQHLTRMCRFASDKELLRFSVGKCPDHRPTVTRHVTVVKLSREWECLSFRQQFYPSKPEPVTRHLTLTLADLSLSLTIDTPHWYCATAAPLALKPVF